MKGVTKLGVLVGILLLGSGCSIKMLYNNADRLARWAVNDYIKMTDEQEAYFTAEIDVLAAMSNCPQERNPCNGFNPSRMRVIHYRPE